MLSSAGAHRHRRRAIAFDCFGTLLRIHDRRDSYKRSVATAEDGRSTVRMRSQSWIGRGDFGANARQIVEFHQALEQRL
jgi:hypothetical protein